MALHDKRTSVIVGGYELKIDQVVSFVEEEDAPGMCGCATHHVTPYYLIDYDTRSNAES